MRRNFNIVIADTTCFIILDKIDQLNLLRQLFHHITTTPAVVKELGKPLPGWVIIKPVTDITVQAILELEVDEGEASAIALALETTNSLLILDDLKGRKLATKLNLSYTGTFGLFLKAKEEGIIGAVKPLLDLIQSTNFRFSQNIIQEILRQANE